MNRIKALVICTCGIMLLLVSCAMQPAATMVTPQKITGDQYVPKVDNFIVLFDASNSMNESHRGTSKFNYARQMAALMHQTIPDIPLQGGLRAFGPGGFLFGGGTQLVYGMTPYQPSDFQPQLDGLTGPYGNSPLGDAIDAARQDLKDTRGRTAVIIVSDGMETGDGAVAAAQRMLAAYRDRVCIHTVQVGQGARGKALLEQVAKTSGCGIAVNADAIADSPAMADYVTQVFLTNRLDQDGDGVYDDQDRCPGTPQGVAVDARGCPLDTDGDGVYDYQDDCPGTPQGVSVDARGCPPPEPQGAKVTEKGTWIYENVRFDTAKADIKTESFPVLNQIVTFLTNNPTLRVEIQGHTDSRGKMDYNMRLSDARAQAVKAYLIDNGIDPKRLTAKGYGPQMPVATNATAEGRAQNRRVELKPLR
jgi:OOP family OmpA-OmpF porin